MLVIQSRIDIMRSRERHFDVQSVILRQVNFVVIVHIVLIVTVADVCSIHRRKVESVVAGGAVTGVLAGARIGPRTIPTCGLIVSSEANRIVGFDIYNQVTCEKFDVNSGLLTEVIYEVIRFICR